MSATQYKYCQGGVGGAAYFFCEVTKNPTPTQLGDQFTYEYNTHIMSVNNLTSIRFIH